MGCRKTGLLPELLMAPGRQMWIFHDLGVLGRLGEQPWSTVSTCVHVPCPPVSVSHISPSTPQLSAAPPSPQLSWSPSHCHRFDLKIHQSGAVGSPPGTHTHPAASYEPPPVPLAHPGLWLLLAGPIIL